VKLGSCTVDFNTKFTAAFVRELGKLHVMYHTIPSLVRAQLDTVPSNMNFLTFSGENYCHYCVSVPDSSMWVEADII
jgi:hypothetical protein